MRLKSLKRISQMDTLSKYYSSLHGWIYKQKLANSVFSGLHGKVGFKYFSLSNLIGVENETVEQDGNYKITISSPNKELIKVIKDNLQIGELINLGEYSFEIVSFYDYEIRLNKFSVIETTSIIVVTEHLKKSTKIKSLDFLKEDERGRYLYMLKKNLIRKYNTFNGKNVSEKYDLWRCILIEPIMKGKYSIYCEPLNFKFIGNKLRFKLGAINTTQREILNFAFDAGFGAYCPYGMGFMVEKKEFDELKSMRDFNKLVGK